MKRSKNVALVLSSGGARGLAHIGVINTLEKHGYNITSIAGTSMGALVGGLYATGQLKVYEDWAKSLDKRSVLRLVDLTISANGLVKGDKIINELESLIPNRNIEDLDIPFCAVATDILNEKEIVFETGNLYDAIRASISIPTVFKPYKIGDVQLVDGGVVNPIPINRVSRMKKDKLIVADVNARSTLEVPVVKAVTLKKNQPENIALTEDEEYERQILKKLKHRLSNIIPSGSEDRIGYFNLINKSTSLMLHVISEYSLLKNPPDLLINIPRGVYGTYDFYKAADIIQFGADCTEKALENLK